MELKDLNAAERVALVALVHRCVLSDNSLSVTENEDLGLLASAMGEDSYQAVAEVANSHIQNLDKLREVLDAVTNPEARELIYGTLMEIAIDETVGPGESELLDLVGEVWGLRPSFEGFPSESEDEPSDEKK